MNTQQHSIFCIIPPYMLANIVKNGTPTQRALAAESLRVSTEVRMERESLKETAVSGIAAMLDRKQRVVYNAAEGTTLPGVAARSEGDPPTGDMAVDEAYDGAGATYDLFRDVYDRKSIDGRGMRLDSTVHYGKGYDNAFWNGSQMVYGDGDEDLPVGERLFNRFTVAVDIIGHELTHGVTQHEAALAYKNQPGALNESMSDVFGSLVKQRVLGQTARNADWLIGAGIFTANVNGRALRSMKAPGTAYDDPLIGKDNQPGHMDQYQDVDYDNGGVHLNSGIPNRAFYIAAYEIDGFAWEKAGQIWYAVLRDKLHPSSTFQEAANLTVETAAALFGANSLEQQAVQKGWVEVGITPVIPAPAPPSPPNPAPGGCRPSLKSLLAFW